MPCTVRALPAAYPLPPAPTQRENDDPYTRFDIPGAADSFVTQRVRRRAGYTGLQKRHPLTHASNAAAFQYVLALATQPTRKTP
jgi:hypothetical protein